MKRVLAAALVGLWIGVSVSAQPKHQRPWAIVDLGVLPGAEFSEARGINNLGQIVGKSGSEGGPVRASLWEDGVMTDLGTLGGAFSDAWDINDVGQVVGIAQTGSGAVHAFIWQDGQMVDLDPHGVVSSGAFQINNEGVVVGHIGSQPVIWQNGETIELELSFARAINDRGEVAGVLSDPIPDAVIWSRGRIIELDPFEGAAMTQSSDINRRGQVTGTATIGDVAGSVRAFVSRGRRLIDLGGLYDDGSSFGNGINRSGHVVGSASFAPTTLASHAVLWTHQGRIIDLGTLPDEGVTCRFPPCLSSSGRAINDLGQVVGTSQNADGQWRAVTWMQ